jgi:hypothetical protein
MKIFKIILFLFIIINIIFLSMKEVLFSVNFDSPEFAAFLDNYISEKIKKTNIIMDKRFDGTVITTYGGYANIVLANDVNTEIKVQNPNEISLEVGDQVSIIAVDGNLSNSVVDYRKGITLSDIYVDDTTGFDGYGLDSSGNQYGTENAPFKTLQYAIYRLPKNLNSRIYEIYFSNLDVNEQIIIDGFHGAGQLIIKPKTGTSVSYINSIFINGCSGTEISIQYVGASSITRNAIRVRKSFYVILDNCNVITSSPTYYGIEVDDGSRCTIKNTTISNRYAGIFAGSVSSVFSQNNSGSNNNFGLGSWYGSTIGKTGTQPIGTASNEWTDTSSIIR